MYNIFDRQIPSTETVYKFVIVKGVMEVYAVQEPVQEPINSSNVTVATDEGKTGEFVGPRSSAHKSLFQVPSFQEFLEDFSFIKKTCFMGETTSYSHKRLELLTARFNLHVLLNGERETQAQKSVPHRDFYNVRKVDTHVHHSASMNQKHLLRFIKHKLKTVPDEVVINRDGCDLTLGTHALAHTPYIHAYHSCTYSHTFTRTRIQNLTHRETHSLIHTHTHTYTHTYLHTSLHAPKILTNLRTHSLGCAFTLGHTYIHKHHTDSHTHSQTAVTHSQTHIHTHTDSHTNTTPTHTHILKHRHTQSRSRTHSLAHTIHTYKLTHTPQILTKP